MEISQGIGMSNRRSGRIEMKKACYCTLTFIFARLPLPEVTVIVALPFAFARSFPVVLFTVTTFLLDDWKVSVSVHPLGPSLTFAIAVVPFFIFREAVVNLTLTASI